ncbi:MAG: glutathione S-transferase family protein [Solirubrobacteraceae bacterium]
MTRLAGTSDEVATAAEDYCLYWHPGTCARVTLTALEEINEPFRAVVPHLFGDAKKEYLRLSPKGKVPTLVARGQVITETPAIITYLHQRHPGARLLPADREFEALELMSWFAAGVHRNITLLRFPRNFCSVPEAFESIRDTARRALQQSFSILEARLADRDWLLEQWSIVDAYMLWLWFRATGSGLDGREFGRCQDHAARCEQRSTVARVLDLEERLYPQLVVEGLIPEGLPEYQVGRSPKFAS